MDYAALNGSHDLRLGDWGPYSKRYIGLSHLADKERGWRFDFCAAPGLYRRKSVLPSVRWECGYHPWEASPDLAYFCHRHELEWKDRVYADIAFCPVSENLRLMRCELVNTTPTTQNLTLHLLSSLHRPPQIPALCTPGAGAYWIDALAYNELIFAQPRPQDNLCYDALRRGQVRGSGFVGGSGIGHNFGADAGDTVRFVFTLPAPVSDAALLLRYRLPAGQSLSLRLSGVLDQSCKLCGIGDFATLLLPCAALAGGTQTLWITSCGGAGMELDGMVVGARAGVEATVFAAEPNPSAPQFARGERENTLLVQYPGVAQQYGLWWSQSECVVREFCMDELEPYFYDRIHDHVSSRFTGRGEGHTLEIFLRPLVLGGGTRRVVHALVAQGTAAEVAALLAGAPADPEQLETVWRGARAQAARMHGNPTGGEFVFSQERMAATVLTNCVYPAYAKGRHIRHHTPGRWWDSLYTWDSGFIGLGLLELSADRAIDNLNAYLTAPGDDECAFVHHGSPVPVQHYLFCELWNRTRDRGMLAYFYPRLKQYYEFLAGRRGSSDTRLGSNLLATWTYFYNSGGWDDYPPQQFFHENRAGLPGVAAPAVTAAHAIRAAKILRLAAIELGLTQDLPAYDADIAAFSGALESLSWDAEAGYYSYVLHEGRGAPRGLLRHASGKNFNMGLDGLSPLVADICPPQRRADMYGKIADPARLWTTAGISTVDQSAPYYRQDGYWNGAVWFPHQWFFWKAALGHGQGELAWRIARTALELWRDEVGESYNCFEHFIIASRRGAGWHHFGGLSAPVLSWFGAYFRPGRITGGFDCWVKRADFAADLSSCEAELQISGADAGTSCVLVTLMPGTYAAEWNGQAAPLEQPVPGCCALTLPAQGQGVLRVRRAPC